MLHQYGILTLEKYNSRIHRYKGDGYYVDRANLWIKRQIEQKHIN